MNCYGKDVLTKKAKSYRNTTVDMDFLAILPDQVAHSNHLNFDHNRSCMTLPIVACSVFLEWQLLLPW